MTENERRHGVEEIITSVEVMRERQVDFEKRFDRHEEGEFARYDDIKEHIQENSRQIAGVDKKLSGLNGWMVGFGSACATLGGILAFLLTKMFTNPPH